MLTNEQKIVLNILASIKNNNFVTIEGLKDFYDNNYDKLIEKLSESHYFSENPVHLTYKGILCLEKLEKENSRNIKSQVDI